MLTPEEGETWAHKFYLIGDAYMMNEQYLLNRYLSELLRHLQNTTICPREFTVIIGKYKDLILSENIILSENDEKWTSNYLLWSEIMQLPVQSEVNGQRVILLDLLNEKISNNDISRRDYAYPGQGPELTAHIGWYLATQGFRKWHGLITYLAELFQGETGTPPSTPVPIPTIAVPEDGLTIQPNPNLFQLTPNQAHPGLNPPIMNGPGSNLNPFVLD